MKRYLKIIFIIVGLFLGLCLTLFGIDRVRVQQKKHPIFCKRTVEYWDGGSYECYGLFYKINTYTDIHGKIEKMEIGSYSMEFQKKEQQVKE